MSHNTTTLGNVSQTCKAMSNFASETKTLYVNTQESVLFKNLYVDEKVDATINPVNVKIKSRAVGVSGGIAAPTATTTGAATTKADTIAALCSANAFTVVELNNYEYSNTITNVTSTTT
jgi:hypothetical protein